MKRTDRLFGILLRLRSGKRATALELAERFEVSVRTIYRDMETLSALGVPVYAEPGRSGGFRLLDGYFLPAIAFTRDEATSLLLGLALLGRLRSRPFAAGLDSARAKLLAAMPAHLSASLAAAETLIGFEAMPNDAFHPERALPRRDAPAETEPGAEGEVIDTALEAILAGVAVQLDYRSPYRDRATATITLAPRGLFWDRDRWYLAGERLDRPGQDGLWRADRVAAIRRIATPVAPADRFDVRDLLGRRWLAAAMEQWSRQAPVRVRVSPAQAERLRQDWYYGLAHYQRDNDDSVVLTFGEDDPANALELLRWLGPGAELLEPDAWRPLIRDELRRMLDHYA